MSGYLEGYNFVTSTSNQINDIIRYFAAQSIPFFAGECSETTSVRSYRDSTTSAYTEMKDKINPS